MLKANIPTCCAALEQNLQRIDSRGSHVAPIIGLSRDAIYWGILYRNYDYENFKLRPEEYKTLTVEKSGGYKYCPYCGKNLPDVTNKSVIAFAHRIELLDCTATPTPRPEK